MPTKWFCKTDDKEFGPLLIAQLQRLLAQGQLKADSYVRREDSDTWVLAAQVPELEVKLGPHGSSSTPTRRQPSSPPSAPAQTAPQAPPVESEPSIHILTQPKPAAPEDGTPANRSSSSGAVSPMVLVSVIGLGCVVVILLVAIVVLLTQDEQAGQKQTADSHQSAVDSENGKPTIHKTAAGEAPAKQIQAAQQEKFSGVGDWAKASSILFVKHKGTGVRMCDVRISSIWSSNDPKGGNQNSDPPVETPRRSLAAARISDDEVFDAAALGVSKKKRVDVTGRILEPEEEPLAPAADSQLAAAEENTDPARFRYLFLQVALSNASADALTYLGWNGDGETVQDKDACLFDQDGNECLFVSRIESPREDRQAETTLVPGEEVLDVLVFELPARFERLHLVLPREAFGLSECLGFEINKTDIAGVSAAARQPTSTKPVKDSAGSSHAPPSAADLEREIQKERAENMKAKEKRDPLSK